MSTTNNTSTGKRLAKNTAFMYFRMLLLMGIAMYTSRVVLQQLGAEDLGIYSLVGTVVAMFSSLRVMLATSTQRFLNYEMGVGSGKEQMVFNMSMIINLGIAALFILLVEPVGIYFLNYEAVIAPERMFAAYWVLQMSLLAAIVNIFTTPYDAIIIAHERMDFYAYIAIVEGICKLAIAMVLKYVTWDKLIVYSTLVLAVALLVRYANLIYCKIHFKESHYKWLWDKEMFLKMTQFSGWNFLGNLSYHLSQNGLNMLLNTFSGPVVNAARHIAFQVNDIVKQFLNNVMTVVTPFSIKSYAEQRLEQFETSIFLSSKVLYLVQLMISIPLLFVTPWLLQIWLGEVPEYSVEFLQLMLLIAIIRSIHGPIDTVFKAYGDLKYYQITEGILLAMPIPLSYLALRWGAPLTIVFETCIVTELVNLAIILYLAKRVAGFNSGKYALQVVLPAVCEFVLLAMGYICLTLLGTNVMVQIAIAAATMMIVLLHWWGMMLGKRERELVINVIKKKKIDGIR